MFSGAPTLPFTRLADSDTGYAAGVGHTLLVTEGAPELLTGLLPDLTVIT